MSVKADGPLTADAAWEPSSTSHGIANQTYYFSAVPSPADLLAFLRERSVRSNELQAAASAERGRIAEANRTAKEDARWPRRSVCSSESRVGKETPNGRGIVQMNSRHSTARRLCRDFPRKLHRAQFLTSRLFGISRTRSHVAEIKCIMSRNHYRKGDPAISMRISTGLFTQAWKSPRTRSTITCYPIYSTPLRPVDTLDTAVQAYYNRPGMLLGPLRWRTA
jgi:hypothetical protein